MEPIYLSLVQLSTILYRILQFYVKSLLEPHYFIYVCLSGCLIPSRHVFYYVCEYRAVARVGELVNLEVCMDIMDLLYEKDETSILYSSPRPLAASILACSI